MESKRIFEINPKHDEEKVSTIEINSIINRLEICTNNPKLLTEAYTDILLSDNVVYILTRISQNGIFMKHFKEFYEHKQTKNEYGETEVFPESVINCQQNSKYHKYGVFKHILHTVEVVGEENLSISKNNMKLLKWTMLLHDIGKPFVKEINENGSESFEGHDEKSFELAGPILDRLDFTIEEKQIILTLIRYHDKYLNVGEITYDNLSFLAHELQDSKQLFDLLIEVKIADNKAKSEEVEQTFMKNVTRYYEFENEYFANKLNSVDESLMVGMDDTIELDASGEIVLKNENNASTKKLKGKISVKNKELNTEDFLELYDNVLNGQDVDFTYEPIVNINEANIEGYVVNTIAGTKIEYSLDEIKLKAIENDKYEKISQQFFVNAINKINANNLDRTIAQYTPIDANSYETYNNKSRFTDVFDENEVVIELVDYEEMAVSQINKIQKEVEEMHANISLTNFEKNKYSIDDVRDMGVYAIEYVLNSKNKKTIDENILNELEELKQACDDSGIKLLVKGVKNVEMLQQLKQIKIYLVTGTYFGEASKKFLLTNYEIEEKMKNTQ